MTRLCRGSEKYIHVVERMCGREENQKQERLTETRSISALRPFPISVLLHKRHAAPCWRCLLLVFLAEQMVPPCQS